MSKGKTKRGAAKPQTPTKANAAKSAKAKVRRETFVAEYLKDFNGAQAAIRSGYAPSNARFQASSLLAESEVQEMLAKAMVERAQRAQVSADEVLRHINQIRQADSRELSELHVGACRYCHGKGHLFQRTPREMEEARQALADRNVRRKKKSLAPLVFSEAGGVGYNPTRAPHPECPECFGQGEPRVVLKDTRNLSPEGRLLFAGVKQTQHGIQILQHSQTEQLANLGKHFGLFREKLELSGPNGKPLKAGVVVVPAKASTTDSPKTPKVADATLEPLKKLREKFQVKARK